MIWFITRRGEGCQKVTNPLFVEVNDDNSGHLTVNCLFATFIKQSIGTFSN